MNKTYQNVLEENTSVALSSNIPPTKLNIITVDPYAREFQNGEKILKHGKGVSPHSRRIRIKDGKLRWGQGCNVKSINMKDILQLIVGKFTSTFANSCDIAIPAELCLSIVTQDRDLDIQFYSIQQRNKWLNVIVSILQSLRKYITNLKSLEQLIYGHNAFDTTVDINKTPLICAITHETLQKLKIRLSVPNLAKVDESSAEWQSSDSTSKQIHQSAANDHIASINYAPSAREQALSISVSADTSNYKLDSIHLNGAIVNSFTVSMLDDQKHIVKESNQTENQNLNVPLSISGTTKLTQSNSQDTQVIVPSSDIFETLQQKTMNSTSYSDNNAKASHYDIDNSTKENFNFDQQLHMSMQLLAKQSVNFTNTLRNSVNHTSTGNSGQHKAHGDDSAEVTIAQIGKTRSRINLNRRKQTKKLNTSRTENKTSKAQLCRFSTIIVPSSATNHAINNANKPESNKNSNTDKYDYSRKQYIKSLESDLEMQTKLKEKSQRKCNYLQRTIDELNGQLSRKQKIINSLKQKVEKLETEKHDTQAEKMKLSEDVDYKLKDIQRRENSIKKYMQKSAAIQKKYETLETEHIEARDQLEKLQEIYDELKVKLQNRDSNDRRLTLELNKWKIKNNDLICKLKLERSKQQELSQSIDTIQNEAKLQMEKQKLSFLTKLKDSVNVIKSYEVEIDKINQQNQQLEIQIHRIESDYHRGQIIVDQDGINCWDTSEINSKSLSDIQNASEMLPHLT